jgi:hypothetical protein
MSQAFVHEAELQLGSDADDRAPGGAVTMVLCGHWEHEGSCRWPHHTSIQHLQPSHVIVRIVFASSTDEEQLVRDRITAALNVGRLNGPSGPSTWTLVRDAPAALLPKEQPLAAALAAEPNLGP